MSTNDEVREYLDYYLSSELETDFAVMINGPWGAGKTHFIKAYLEEREDKARLVDPLYSVGHLYASLYGIRSTSEITDQFFAQAHPVMNSKAVRLIGTVMSRALNGFAGTDVNSGAENKSLIKDMVLKLEGRVLIFDDLERCAMPLVEAMGFINSFVEHDGLKVIVVANENDIPPDQRIDYARKKEKLIGKTLRVASDPHTVLDSFCKKLTHPRVLEVVRQETLALLRTFEGSGKKNFRSLRAVLSDYERLVSGVDPRLQKSDTGMARLLLFMMATGVDYRSGDLSASELAGLPSTRQSRLIAAIGKKEKSPEIVKVEGLEARYPEVQWDDPIVPPAALAALFETGIVAADAINAHLSQHPLVVGYAQAPAWRQLWSWTDLPRSQYLEAREELVRQLATRELTHPGVILHAAGIVIGAMAFGDHMLGRDKDVVAYFGRYVQDLQKSGKLEPDRGLFTPMGGSYGGLGYGSKDTSEFRAIYKTVRAATNLSFADRMKEIAGTFIERINKDREAYSSLHKYGVEEGNYADSPFLHYVDPDAFARVIIRDSSPDGQLLASLHARYEMEKHNRALSDEYPWIKALRSRLEAIASEAEPPHRELLAIRIKYYFDKIEQAVGARTEATDIDTGDEAAINEELAG
ncbi:P-loop NTPase fold protein [Rhodoligotrophos ferricapiens]|uniref:P-loop NTPase fold protein n=1 Tax=Rhodoligotrophos ferricapiens TaxID=3069264 RepID=UPI00315C4F95